MKKDNVIQMKSYDFGVRAVKLYKHLSSEKKEFVLSKQLLRSGTSIGANVEEAIGGHSRKDFFAKLLIEDIEEILKIIGSIQKTIRNTNS